MHKAISVTVIGAGLMGHGIGQVFARAGHEVVITDPNATVLNMALERVEANLVSEGVDVNRVLCNMRVDGTLQSAVAQADLVIEAAPEKLALKQKLFADVAAAAPRHAVLASNTSVIPITRIGEGSS